MNGILHRDAIIRAVDKERHPAHDFDLFHCVTFYRLAVIRD